METVDLSAGTVNIIANVRAVDLETFEIEAERKRTSVDAVVTHILAEGARKLRQGRTFCTYKKE